jgi:drug/metabolite transporter (DMT)-like permease
LFVIALSFVLKRTVWVKIQRKDIKWFLIWILPASVQPVITFIAFNHLPIGTTLFLVYAAMVVSGIVSGKIFFQEKFSSDKLISSVLIFAGLFLIYQSDISLATSIYALFAALSGLMLGFWGTLTKKVSQNYPPFQMILLDAFPTFLVGIIGASITKEVLPPVSETNAWLWIIPFGLSSILAGSCLIRGFKYVEAQIGTLIMPTELVFASIFGYLFFGEILKFPAYTGGFLILLAAIIPALIVKDNKTI